MSEATDPEYCDKIARTLPEFRPQWTVRRGIAQLYGAYKKYALTHTEFIGAKYLRIKRIKTLHDEARLDANLRWIG